MELALEPKDDAFTDWFYEVSILVLMELALEQGYRLNGKRVYKVFQSLF